MWLTIKWNQKYNAVTIPFVCFHLPTFLCWFWQTRGLGMGSWNPKQLNPGLQLPARKASSFKLMGLKFARAINSTCPKLHSYHAITSTTTRQLLHTTRCLLGDNSYCNKLVWLAIKMKPKVQHCRHPLCLLPSVNSAVLILTNKRFRKSSKGIFPCGAKTQNSRVDRWK